VRVDGLRGAALLQVGDTDVVAVGAGPVEAGREATCSIQTRFQLASVSKQFTAAAVLALADRGALGLDDPVSSWIGGCPASWATMSIHHLLTHTAGLVHWRHIPALSLTATITPDEELAHFFDAPLLSAPGTTYSYSSPGYVLLAHVVQRAADLRYPEFLDQALFGPLGMSATFAGNGEAEKGRAVGHVDGTPVESFELDVVGMGAGDVWSTAGDVARWDRALAKGSVLSDKARSAMRTVHTLVNDGDVTGPLVQVDGYGYGLYLGSDGEGRHVVFHTGDNAGFLALNAWFPDDDVRLVVLANDETVPVQAIAAQLLGAALGR
jgi:CubicO group peptidase (beta-lactamase class C family)